MHSTDRPTTPTPPAHRAQRWRAAIALMAIAMMTAVVVAPSAQAQSARTARGGTFDIFALARTALALLLAVGGVVMVCIAIYRILTNQARGSMGGMVQTGVLTLIAFFFIGGGAFMMLRGTSNTVQSVSQQGSQSLSGFEEVLPTSLGGAARGAQAR